MSQPGVKRDSSSVESVRSSVSNISINDVNVFIQNWKEEFSNCFGIQGENSIPVYYCNYFKTINQETKETWINWKVTNENIIQDLNLKYIYKNYQKINSLK